MYRNYFKYIINIIFISNINPYPNIRNYLNNFLKYKDETNPKIRIKANDIKNNTFYLSIEGNLNFNLNIEKKIFEGNADDLILSEGEYYYETYNIKLHKGDINEKFTTFGENFTLESESFLVLRMVEYSLLLYLYFLLLLHF